MFLAGHCLSCQPPLRQWQKHFQEVRRRNEVQIESWNEKNLRTLMVQNVANWNRTLNLKVFGEKSLTFGAGYLKQIVEREQPFSAMRVGRWSAYNFLVGSPLLKEIPVMTSPSIKSPDVRRTHAQCLSLSAHSFGNWAW